MAKKNNYSKKYTLYPHTCCVCAEEFSNKHPHAKTCSYKCAGVYRSGSNAYNYDTGAVGAGRTTMANGYIGARENRGDRTYRYEHIVIAEKALGRPLPKGAVVHHVDGNPSNNSPSNLVICENTKYHRLLHKRARVLAAGKTPGIHMYCSKCKQWLHIWRFHPKARKNTSDWCKTCRGVADRARRKAVKP